MTTGCAAACNLEFQRCVCVEPSDALLHADGFCESVPRSRQSCTPKYEVFVALQSAPSPELELYHVSNGNVTRGLASATLWAMSRGLQCKSVDIALGDFSLVGTENELTDSVSKALMFYDLQFSFCALKPGMDLGLELGTVSTGFQERFINGLGRYTMFAVPATAQVAYIRSLIPTTRKPPVVKGGDGSQGSSSNDGDHGVQVLLVFVIAILIVFTGISFGAYVLYRKRKQRLYETGTHPEELYETGTHPEESEKVGPEVLVYEEGGQSEILGMLGVAIFGFDPSEVGASASTEDSVDCLVLSEGDVVQVFTSQEGWLYGRHCASHFFGYFPENRMLMPDPPLVVQDVLSEEEMQEFSPGSVPQQPPTPSHVPPGTPFVPKLNLPNPTEQHEKQSSNREFHPGDTVQLLDETSNLHSQYGVLGTFIETSGRWCVKFPLQQTKLQTVRPENLTLVADSKEGTNYSQMKASELKKLCACWGIPTEGMVEKAELVAALQAAATSSP